MIEIVDRERVDWLVVQQKLAEFSKSCRAVADGALIAQPISDSQRKQARVVGEILAALADALGAGLNAVAQRMIDEAQREQARKGN